MPKKSDLMPGTLDMMILKTFTRGPQHGYGIASSIKRASDDVLTVEEGSLYPALQRLLLQSWVKAEWKIYGDQPASPVLHADGCWTEATGPGAVAVRSR